MTIARKRTGRLTLVTVVLAFVLGGGCGGDPEEPDPTIEVSVTVTKDGDGTGTVTSQAIRDGRGGVVALDCGPSCMFEFPDADGEGAPLLTATPDPGSEHSG